MIKTNSNRLFSSFLSHRELDDVKQISYFPLLKKENELSLLPSDHGYYYPLSFNYVDKKISSGELNFFNTVLFENYDPANVVASDKINLTHKSNNHNTCLIVNLVDNCYGHSFLKLLNLIEIYKQFKADYDIWVICPKPLAHFVPEDKFFLATIKLGFEEAKKCPDLQPVIDAIKQKYSSFDFVTLDTYSTYKDQETINSFFGFLPHDKAPEKRYITFYYRSDYFRSWSGRKQRKKIISFFKFIQPYFSDSEFVVAGDLDDLKFPAPIKDIRTNAFGKHVDLDYNTCFHNSHMVIGLIGSNMLQPSMTCDFTVHLVPRPKITIVAEEVFNHEIHSIPGWFKNIYLFGDDDLSDLSPEKLGEQIVLLYLTYIAKKYKEEAYSDRNFSARISQQQFYKERYGFFDLKKANELKKAVTNFSFKRNLLRYRISRLLSKIGLQ